MNEFIQRLEDLKKGMNTFIDKLCFSYGWHVRIIDEDANYDMIDNNTEISPVRWDKRSGWSKPDKIFGDVEIRYLWKDFHPKTGKYK